MNIFTSVLLVFTIIFLSACGGSSSDSSAKESIKIGKDTYTCSTEVSVAKCVLANVLGKTEEALVKACVDADCSCSGPTCK